MWVMYRRIEDIRVSFVTPVSTLKKSYLQDRYASALPRGKLERGMIPLIRDVVQLLCDGELLVGAFTNLSHNQVPKITERKVSWNNR